MGLQVVLGVLGCPNLPMAPLTDEDGTAAASDAIGAHGTGVCFAAQQGGGASVPGGSWVLLLITITSHLGLVKKSIESFLC